MHKYITRDEAIALYKVATKAIQYDGIAKGSTITLFESSSVVVQVNTFATGRKEYFTQPRHNLIDNLFEECMNTEDNSVKIK